MERDLEAVDRLAKAFGAEAESLMMDRHDEISVGFISHLHGLFRSAVRLNPVGMIAESMKMSLTLLLCQQPALRYINPLAAGERLPKKLEIPCRQLIIN